MYTITNTSPSSASIIYDISRRPRSIPPGGSITADITEKQASRYGRSSRLKLKGEDGSAPPKPERRPKNLGRGAPRPRGPRVTAAVIHEQAPEQETEQQSNSPTEETQVEMTRSQRAKNIIARYENDKISYSEASAEAKELLGDEWPGGTPKRTVLYKMLRSVED